MKEVEIKLQKENRSGVVPVGTYLFDAVKRLGVKIDAECGRQGNCDSCLLTIKTGGEILSEPTKVEMEHLNQTRRNKGERLACQAKIEKLGEISIMTAEPKSKPEPTNFESFLKDFEKLPLNEKVGKLLELEQITLGDTFNYILNLPYTIGEFVRDKMAEFGYQMEEEEKKAKRPNEHKEETPTAEKAEPKKRTTRTKSDSSAEKKTSTAKKRTVRKPKTSEA